MFFTSPACCLSLPLNQSFLGISFLDVYIEGNLLKFVCFGLGCFFLGGALFGFYIVFIFRESLGFFCVAANKLGNKMDSKANILLLYYQIVDIGIGIKVTILIVCNVQI